jgi:hypothetical protein
VRQLVAYYKANSRRVVATALFQTQYPHLVTKLGPRGRAPKVLGPTDFLTPLHTPGFQWSTSVSDYEKVVKASLFRNASKEKSQQVKSCTKCPRLYPRGEGLPHTAKPKAEHDFTLYWVKGHYHEWKKETRSCVLCEYRIRMDAWCKFTGSDRDSDVEDISDPDKSVAAAGVDKGCSAPTPTIPVATRITIDHSVIFFFSPTPRQSSRRHLGNRGCHQ